MITKSVVFGKMFRVGNVKRAKVYQMEPVRNDRCTFHKSRRYEKKREERKGNKETGRKLRKDAYCSLMNMIVNEVTQCTEESRCE